MDGRGARDADVAFEVNGGVSFTLDAGVDLAILEVPIFVRDYNESSGLWKRDASPTDPNDQRRTCLELSTNVLVLDLSKGMHDGEIDAVHDERFFKSIDPEWEEASEEIREVRGGEVDAIEKGGSVASRRFRGLDVADGPTLKLNEGFGWDTEVLEDLDQGTVEEGGQRSGKGVGDVESARVGSIKFLH